MKGKLLLAAALTSILSINASALEIKNGKLLSHKEWTTGNLASYTTNKTTKADALAFKDNLKLSGITLSDHMTLAYSGASPSNGVPGERTDINGVQLSLIFNDSDGAQVYQINNSLCAQTSDKTTECMFYQDQIMLDARGSAFDIQQPTIQPIFQADGSYMSSTSTVILIENDEYGFSPESIAQSSAVVTISSDGKKGKA